MTLFRIALAVAAVAITAALAGRHSSTICSISSTNPAVLDLSQKAGPLMMVGFRGPELTSEIRQTLRDLHPGGVCLYAQNITGAEQVGRFNDELRLCLDELLPPFLAVDQEGGVVVRIYDGVTVFPSIMAVGTSRSPQLATKPAARCFSITTYSITGNSFLPGILRRQTNDFGAILHPLR